MKIRLFNFIKSKTSRNIKLNYNPSIYNSPIKNISKIPKNTITKNELTLNEKLVQVTELIKRILCRIDEKNKEILNDLKSLS